MRDYLIRGTAEEGLLRVFAVEAAGVVDELRRRHGTLPTATAALGRTAIAGLMMGAMLKGEEKLTLRVKGDGPIGQIVVDADARGDVRGYVDNPDVHLPSNALGKLDVAGAVGTEGYIYVIKDLGLKEPYRGSIPIVSGELGDDFTYYFAKSEQTPSAVALGVLVDTDGSVIAAGGFILQMMPGVRDEEIDRLERALQQLPPVTSLLHSGLSPEQIVERIVPTATILDRMDVRFRCKCSRERVEQTLLSLGRDELQAMIDEEGQAEAVCHFCNEKYRFDREQLERLAAEARG